MFLFSKNKDNTFIYLFWDNKKEIFTQKSYLPQLESNINGLFSTNSNFES